MKVKKHKYKISLRKLKKPKEFKEDMVSKISEFLEIPGELVGDNTKITLVGNKYLYLEGKYKIADYYDYYIRIITKKYALNVSGKNLEISEMKEMELVISGDIRGIEYEIRSIDEGK
ncbi:MAG: YabP/YqfC family sporulation protein [Clostridia bacterium]|nr:YabP/YqfC family sporulation protein [Clostridia bacterium]